MNDPREALEHRLEAALKTVDALKQRVKTLESSRDHVSAVNHILEAYRGQAQQGEELRDTLASLARSREKERLLRLESETILEGLKVIARSDNTEEMLKRLLKVLRKVVQCDGVFIVRKQTGSDLLKPIASDTPIFESSLWRPEKMLQRVLSGRSVMLFDVQKSPEWQSQNSEILDNVRSALHIPFHTKNARAILICTSKEKSYFNQTHIILLQRFTPIVLQALLNLEINEKLLKTNTHMKAILNNMQEGVLVLDSEQRIQSVNPAIEKMFGYRSEQLIGKTTEILYFSHREHRNIRKRFYTAIWDYGVFSTEVQMRHADKTAFPVNLSATFLRLQNDVLGSVEVMRDITEQKRIEEQQQYDAFQAGVAEMSTAILHNIGNAVQGLSYRACRLQDLSTEFLDTVNLLGRVHEVVGQRLANGESVTTIQEELLNVLDQVTSQLRDRINDDLKKHTEHIANNVNHVSEIIRIQQGASHTEAIPTHFNLYRLVEDALAMQESILEKYEICVTLDVPRDLKIRFPRNQLLQVMLNLIKNSREAIAERKNPNNEGGTIQVTADIDASWISLHIMDNGIGATSETLRKLFMRGYSTKNRGSGFGLHSVSNFMRSQGGTIQAESKGRDRGMIMTIRFPKNGD